jgi:hypothetical protein
MLTLSEFQKFCGKERGGEQSLESLAAFAGGLDDAMLAFFDNSMDEGLKTWALSNVFHAIQIYILKAISRDLLLCLQSMERGEPTP